MTTKKGKLSNREIFFITFLILLAVTTAGWHFKGAALVRDLSVLHVKQEQLKSEQALMLTYLQESEQLETEWALLKPEHERLKLFLPFYSELPLALEALEALIKSENVDLNSLHLGQTANQDDCITVALVLHLNAQPYQLLSVIGQLEQFPHLVIFEHIKWIDNAEAGTALELNLKLAFRPQDSAAEANCK